MKDLPRPAKARANVPRLYLRGRGPFRRRPLWVRPPPSVISAAWRRDFNGLGEHARASYAILLPDSEGKVHAVLSG